MSSDISVRSTSYSVDDRAWIIGTHGTDLTPSVTLDISKFTKNTHFPDGYIKSGTPLGKITTSGLYGPYNDSAEDGTEVCAGLLFSFVRAIDPNNGNTLSKVGGAIFVHGAVKESKLPIAINANGKNDLSKIVWL